MASGGGEDRGRDLSTASAQQLTQLQAQIGVSLALSRPRGASPPAASAVDGTT